VQLPLTLRPKPSFALAAALVLAHGLAAAGVVPTGLSLFIKFTLWAVLASSLTFYLRRHVLQSPVRALTLLADGSLDVERHDGTSAKAAVHPQTTVFPWLCVLRLKLADRSLALTLPPDALDAEDYRQLRLWLRWKAAQGG